VIPYGRWRSVALEWAFIKSYNTTFFVCNCCLSVKSWSFLFDSSCRLMWCVLCLCGCQVSWRDWQTAVGGASYADVCSRVILHVATFWPFTRLCRDDEVHSRSLRPHRIYGVTAVACAYYLSGKAWKYLGISQP